MVQDKADLNLYAGPGVAVRESIMRADGLTAWARLEARMASVKLRVLAVADDVADETGDRSTATWLAHETRDAHGATRRAAKLAAAMERCLLVGDALASGSVNNRPSPRHH